MIRYGCIHFFSNLMLVIHSLKVAMIVAVDLEFAEKYTHIYSILERNWSIKLLSYKCAIKLCRD